MEGKGEEPVLWIRIRKFWLYPNLNPKRKFGFGYGFGFGSRPWTAENINVDGNIKKRIWVLKTRERKASITISFF
jgi:hypothetical protein